MSKLLLLNIISTLIQIYDVHYKANAATAAPEHGQIGLPHDAEQVCRAYELCITFVQYDMLDSDSEQVHRSP